MEKQALSESQVHGESDAAASDSIIDNKADIGLQFIKQHGGAVEYSAEEDRRVRTKLDLYLMPIVRHLSLHNACRRRR